MFPALSFSGRVARNFFVAALALALLAPLATQAQAAPEVGELRGTARADAMAEREQVSAALAADPNNPSLLARFVTLSLRVGDVKAARDALAALQAVAGTTPEVAALAAAVDAAETSAAGSPPAAPPAGPAATTTASADGTGDTDPALDPSGSPDIGDPTPGSAQ